ncbi:MAG: helix-turn-helix transcriptional regulator [Eubacteriales bacterium]|jgi:transcriptional regulator with XRE-family HTH domain
MSDFEKIVRKALIDKGLTVKKLAEDMGISPAYLYDIIKGNRPGTKQKEKIAQILELNVTN